MELPADVVSPAAYPFRAAFRRLNISSDCTVPVNMHTMHRVIVLGEEVNSRMVGGAKGLSPERFRVERGPR